MKTLNYFIALGCTVLFASCAKVDVKPVEPEEVSYKISIHAELPELLAQDDTKASAQTGIRLMWTTSDEISVINTTKKQILGGLLSPKTDGSSVQLKGTVTGTIDDADKIAFVYPAITDGSEVTDFTGTVALTDMSGQSATGSYSKFVAFATTTGDAITTADFKFNCVNAFITLNLVGLESAAVSNITLENVGKSCNMSIDTDTLQFTPVSGDIALTGSADVTNGRTVLRVTTYASASGQAKRITLTDGDKKDADWTSSAIVRGRFYNSVVTGFYAIPTVTTDDVTTYTAVSATLTGSAPGANATERGFYYGTTSNPSTLATGTTGTDNSFSCNLSNLTASTTYYVKAYVKANGGKTYYGAVKSFQTQDGKATVKTAAVTNIAPTTATSGGTNITTNGAAITKYGICWGTSSKPTNTNSNTRNEVTGVPTGNSFELGLTGLTKGTKYYVRAYVYTAVGGPYYCADADEVSFTTSTEPAAIKYGNTNFYSIPILGDWDNNASTPDTYLHWAPINCGYEVNGTNVNNDADHRLGLLYQWGWGTNSSAKACYFDKTYNGSTVSSWPSSISQSVSIWDNNDDNKPCPTGWRLPTVTELCVLFGDLTTSIGSSNSSWTTTTNAVWESSNTIAYGDQTGKYAGAKITKDGKSVFFPAAGYRNSSGNMNNRGMNGYYWSSTTPDGTSNACRLNFSENFLYPQVSGSRAFGYSVRCVHE